MIDSLDADKSYIPTMRIMRAARCLLLSHVIVLGCGRTALSDAPALPWQEFVGTTPGDARSREFLGGLAADAPCHCVTWHLTFLADQKTGQPATYKLVAQYGLPGRDDPNQIEDGPTVKLEGKWEIAHGHKSNAQAVVYRLHGKNADATLSLIQIGKNLFHFLERDNTLRIGNAGWSYTLNRKGIARDH